MSPSSLSTSSCVRATTFCILLHIYRRFLYSLTCMLIHPESARPTSLNSCALNLVDSQTHPMWAQKELCTLLELCDCVCFSFFFFLFAYVLICNGERILINVRTKKCPTLPRLTHFHPVLLCQKVKLAPPAEMKWVSHINCIWTHCAYIIHCKSDIKRFWENLTKKLKSLN